MVRISKRQLGFITILDYIKNIQSNNVSSHLDMKIQCSDGSVVTCGMLLAAISPIIRDLAKIPLDLDDLIIYVPDFTVGIFFFILTLLGWGIFMKVFMKKKVDE